MRMDEFTLIEKIKKKIPRLRHAALGVGDDAAVLKNAGAGDWVVSTDMLVEGVDFILDELSPERIGRKALAVNLSDLAAMGAVPLAFVISIGKPKHVSAGWVLRFYDGLLKLARQFKTDCVGGDLSGAREFSVSVTVLGKTRRAVMRGGAKAGDWIGVTGKLGGSILRHHWAFSPRIREGKFLAERRFANAMIDISDGLYQDLRHILKASRMGAEVALDRIPIAADALRSSRGDRTAALERALTEGEDFELLFTASPGSKARLGRVWKDRFRGVPLTWIGKIVKGDPAVRWLSGGKCVRLFLASKGFRHF